MILCGIWRCVRLFHALYFLRKENSEKNIEKLKRATHKAGPIGIKLIQNLTSRNDIFNTDTQHKLGGVFEDCTIHKWSHTEKTYFQDFGRHIEDDFVIEPNTSIKSGSIGQVYKLYHRKLNKYVAVKVKHPKIDNKVNEFIFSMSFIICIVKKFVNIPYKQLVLEFTNNVRIQLDFKKEAENTRKLREYLKNDNAYIIPEIYDSSPRFIIMSYHEGTCISCITNPVQRLHLSIYYNFFILTSLLVCDFMHCDMHNGNWKVVVNDDGRLQIIVYDCGIVATLNNKEYSKTMIGAVLESKFNGMTKAVTHESELNTEKYAELERYIAEIEGRKNIIATEKFKMISSRVLELDIKTNEEVMRVIQGLSITGDNITLGVDRFSAMFTESGKVIWLCIYRLIAYNLKMFPSLYDYLTDWFYEDPQNEVEFKEWMDNNYGHTDEDVFSEVLCDIFEIPYIPLPPRNTVPVTKET